MNIRDDDEFHKLFMAARNSFGPKVQEPYEALVRYINEQLAKARDDGAMEREAHLMQSHEGLMDAASAKYLIEKAERERNRMRAVFFVNMLKAFPDKASDEIMAEIDKACRDERMTDYMARTHAEFAESLKNASPNEVGALCGPLKTTPRLDSDPVILDEDLPSRALKELTEQAQELDMGYGKNACPTCGKSNA